MKKRTSHKIKLFVANYILSGITAALIIAICLIVATSCMPAWIDFQMSLQGVAR